MFEEILIDFDSRLFSELDLSFLSFQFSKCN